MTKRRERVTDLMNRRIEEENKGLVTRYNAEIDPERKMELKYQLVRKAIKSFTVQILSLSERDWKRFCAEQVEPLDKAWEDIGKQHLDERLTQGSISLKDLNLLMLESEHIDRIGKWRIVKGQKQLLSRRKTLERLFILEIIANVQLMLGMAALSILLEPLSSLNQLVYRRFGADENWTVALAVLAVHENLIKKKLSDLNVDGSSIRHMFGKGGLPGLASMLEAQIEQREHRKLSLAFYKSSGLRNVRNKLEHEGYQVHVKRGEVLDLIKEVKALEKELYPPSPEAQSTTI